MRELPDYDSIQDEAFPPLPPPASPGGADHGDPFADGEEDGDLSKLAEVPAAKRKGVKRPQPKLDSQRLTSERGLPALRTLFDDVQFKGKGHEAENLRLLMQKMENWAHRLYPKLQFEDFIDRVEKLGSKKEVQTCLKRVRLDMPLTHEDFTSKDGEEAAAPEENVYVDPDPFSGPSFSSSQPIHSTPAPPAAAPPLTEEQRRRMELNRQRALERKLARQQQHADVSHSQVVDPSDTLKHSTDRREEEEEEEEKEKEKEEEKEGEEPVSSSTPEPSSASPQREEEAAVRKRMAEVSE